MSQGSTVYLIDGARTPFLKARGKPGPFRAIDLALGAGRPLLLRQTFDTALIDEVILGCVAPGPEEANIARIAALRLGLPERITAFTVQRNCASGLQAIDSAWRNIKLGTADIVLAGGVEAMSHAPLLFPDEMANWLADFRLARKLPQRLRSLLKLRPRMFVPVIGLAKGLTDPVVNLSMGQTAEMLAERFAISRHDMDEFALHSHQRLGDAQAGNRLQEIVPVYDASGQVYASDDGYRADSSLERLAKLKPAFDKPYGKITAGNSAQITDGCALLVLASEQAIERHKLQPLARIVDIHWAGLDPAVMGLGPVHASTPLLTRNGLGLDDIDLWEINEAFAAQVLACVAAWKSPEFCREKLGMDAPLGRLDPDKLNIDGGAIALGHPVGASGARIALHLANRLQADNKRLGIATLCIGGGQGGAMLIESV